MDGEVKRESKDSIEPALYRCEFKGSLQQGGALYQQVNVPCMSGRHLISELKLGSPPSSVLCQ